MFSSQEITRNCGTDVWLQHCFGDAIPFRSELVSFRRRHRVGLEEVLLRILRSAVSSAGVDREESLELNQAAILEARERLDIARHLDSCDE
jgi:hypothetical protein